MSEKTLREEDLRQFTGTENWWRHPSVRHITYTDGVRYVAQAGEAYWLIDEIALANVYAPAVKAEEFQFWKLTRDKEGNGATLTCKDGGKEGDEPKVVYSKRIPFTDFPLPEITLYFTNDVILLPSEN